MDEPQVERGIIKTLEAAGDVDVDRSIVGAVDAHNVTLRGSAAGALIASGDVSIENGGCQSIVAAGGVTVAGGAFVGLVASPRVSIDSGARVLMSAPQAAAFGAAHGLVISLLARRRR